MLEKKPVLHHLLKIQSLDKPTIFYLIKRCQHFLETDPKTLLNKAPLETKIMANLFFEPSNRTQNSFEIAANRLGAIVLNPNVLSLAKQKGESLTDIARTLEAMGASILVLRHPDNFAAELVANHIGNNTSVINAGDGTNQHPTQSLLDLFTIYKHKKSFENLRVCIVGDIAHSRVARSFIQSLKIVGVNDIRLAAPEYFIPAEAKDWNVSIFNTLTEGLEDADVVMTLRIQKERIQQNVTINEKKFIRDFGLNEKNVAYAKSDAIIMHPGPINRGIEIDSGVADGAQSTIFEQVRNGVAMRMAVLDTLVN